MKHSRIVMRFAMLLMTMFCAAICSYGQSDQDQATVKEKLANGEYIIVINGQSYRAITADHAREIADRKAKLEGLEKENDLLNQKIALHEREIGLERERLDLEKQRTAIARQEADTWKAQFTLERDLRLNAEKTMKKSRIASIIDSTPMKIFTGLVVPIGVAILKR
jgi:hypothetical protein